MSAEQLTVAVIGAGGKMGMRVSANLQKSSHTVTYSENSPAGQDRVRAEGREITATDDAVKGADVVILAVPDTVLGHRVRRRRPTDEARLDPPHPGPGRRLRR
ncbi:NAD(P)-binding domain-containing protein, partial [Arthrobacter sp. Hiyo1]|uniref:NAD(P)-binding domain-containing protein n=1 Tax=Arthrobacter sp. Hiyo1 TaxID=1588020 RepID=UPI000AADCE7A